MKFEKFMFKIIQKMSKAFLYIYTWRENVYFLQIWKTFGILNVICCKDFFKHRVQLARSNDREWVPMVITAGHSSILRKKYYNVGIHKASILDIHGDTYRKK